MYLGFVFIDFMLKYFKICIQLILNDNFVDLVMEGFDFIVRIVELFELFVFIEYEIVEVKWFMCVLLVFLKEWGNLFFFKDLIDLLCFYYGNLLSGNSWKLDGLDGLYDICVNGVLCLNNVEVLRDVVVKGMGIVLLFIFIVGVELQEG